MNRPVPVVDLFAGPGGLSEGFASLLDERTDNPVFRVGVSVEKDPVAARTLALRAFFRHFPRGCAPDAYYDHLRGNRSLHDLLADPLFAYEAEAAREEAICAELGRTPAEEIDKLVRKVVGDNDLWVLIGGPPCQAYSIVGRSRLRGENPEKYASDPRHLLYKEYLRVIRTHAPAVFVMENVKGILTSMHAGKHIFERILADLTKPAPDLEYEIRPLIVQPTAEASDGAMDFLIQSELYGVPQTRHRVILLGIRSDLKGITSDKLSKSLLSPTVRNLLGGLPQLRSRLSREKDSHSTWLSVVKQSTSMLAYWKHARRDEIAARMESAVVGASCHYSVGGPFSRHAPHYGAPTGLTDWLRDDRLEGICQHETRAHMRADLNRYLWASSYASVMNLSPRLADFPPKLQPDHANAADNDMPFKDRFRVQLWDAPSTTVVSHIAKDGHYFIHPDPAQCRALTVREAARLQTFPDNYFFEGSRTEQYTQVGNAVPPYLAKQIGRIVAKVLRGSSDDAAQPAKSAKGAVPMIQDVIRV